VNAKLARAPDVIVGLISVSLALEFAREGSSAQVTHVNGQTKAVHESSSLACFIRASTAAIRSSTKLVAVSGEAGAGAVHRLELNCPPGTSFVQDPRTGELSVTVDCESPGEYR
jgi:hypothetical protein